VHTDKQVDAGQGDTAWETLLDTVCTHLAVIPSGLTSQLQPLDVSVNKLFKGFMHEEWAKWIEAPTHHVTLAGRVKRPLISNVCEWVKILGSKLKVRLLQSLYKMWH